MGYYLGQFYFDKKELFLILLILLLIPAIYWQYPVPFFHLPQIFVLSLLLLFTKALVASSRDTPLYFVFLTALFLTLFIKFFTIILFVFIALFLLKLTKTL